MLINPIISLISFELVGSDLNIGQHVFPSLCVSNKLTSQIWSILSDSTKIFFFS